MWHLKRPWARKAVLALMAALLGAFLSGCGGKKAEPVGLPGEGQGDTIATYKGGQITQTEFDKFTAYLIVEEPTVSVYLQIPAFKEQFVRQLALYKVLAGQATDAQKKEAEESAAFFAEQLDEYLKAYPAMQEEMTKRGVSADELKTIRRVLAAADMVISGKAEELAGKVKEEEVRAEFDKNPNDYNIVTVRHILVSTMDLATGEEKRTKEEALERVLEAKSKLEQGAGWDEIAKEYSEDPGSKDNGGLYENQRAGLWVTEFKNAANTQKVGVIGDPVETMYGYHIIKVESRDIMTFDKLDEATKDELKQAVLDSKVQNYLLTEAEKLDIKVNLPAEETPPQEETEPAQTDQP